MELLSKWLEKRGREAEEKALDYLNNKGFYCKNTNLEAREQVQEIEKSNARDLYFKDCERKLKNNLRQKMSSDKQPNMKQSTFKISNEGHAILKNLSQYYGLTVGNTLELLIRKEHHSLITQANNTSTLSHYPNTNYTNEYKHPTYTLPNGQQAPYLRRNVWDDDNFHEKMNELKNLAPNKVTQQHQSGPKGGLL
ncbi:hypothetical protein [Chromohalobacter sp. 296-RDG]|uniref:hypothetical protein n=1 Tax=Chromohalobacter sp. 296-RDG TaxID=2994062 RepID=UPI00246998C9|nr:hypothetical protein [Chromohalobacter sp. 296-RDG]